MRLSGFICCAIGALAALAPWPCAATSDGQEGPVTRSIEVVAHPAPSNRLPACRITGEVILWARRPVTILDDTQTRVGTVQAGLAEFAPGARLLDCVADDATIDLSGRFVNFLVVPGSEDGGVRKATALASQLAQDFYHFADDNGNIVPLAHSTTRGALGSVAYRYDIVLIADDASRTAGAVVQRETVRTKFAPVLDDTDRRASRLKWSSEPDVIRSTSSAVRP